MGNAPRKPYPSDVSDEEWAFVTPYLVPLRPDAPQRHHAVRKVDNGLHWMVRTGAQWRALPTTCHRGTRFMRRPSPRLRTVASQT